MNRLVIIKKSNVIQLAHLYEHIFCAHVDTLFYDNHLFQHIDYSLSGKTYYGGVIVIELELYTEAARKLCKRVATLPIQLNQRVIGTAASQLLAEKEEPLGSSGYDNVRLALEDLHQQPWENIDELDILDTKTIRKKPYPLYIAEGSPLPARKLSTNISIDPDFIHSQRELLPLFRQLAWSATVNIQHVLVDSYGYSSFSDSFKATKQEVRLVNTFNVAASHENDVDINDDLKTCLEIIHDIQQHNGFKRLLRDLQAVSYTKQTELAPSIERNYEDTLIFIGAKGWREIATMENCELLLKHMSIEIKFGRQKASSSLIQ